MDLDDITNDTTIYQILLNDHLQGAIQHIITDNSPLFLVIYNQLKLIKTADELKLFLVNTTMSKLTNPNLIAKELQWEHIITFIATVQFFKNSLIKLKPELLPTLASWANHIIFFSFPIFVPRVLH